MEVSSISKLQEHKGFIQSWKLWGNSCSFRWPRPNRRRVRNFNSFGSKNWYMLLWTWRIKDNNLLLNIAIDSEYLMFSPNFNQSLLVLNQRFVAIYSPFIFVCVWHSWLSQASPQPTFFIPIYSPLIFACVGCSVSAHD